MSDTQELGSHIQGQGYNQGRNQIISLQLLKTCRSKFCQT